MITLAQLTEMLHMQEMLEVRIDGPDWRSKGHDYGLCIHMECAEIIDHIGWKHWKNIEAGADWDAVAMELVDVWHFALASSLQLGDVDPATMIKVIEEAQASYDPELDDMDITQHCIGLGYQMYTDDQFCVGDFIAIMDMASMTWNDLYKLYIGKNVLNWFRQDHGYKKGLYMKTWAGKEDNEHLYEITEMLGDKFNSIEVANALTARYALAGH